MDLVLVTQWIWYTVDPLVLITVTVGLVHCGPGPGYTVDLVTDTVDLVLVTQ